MTLTLLAVCGYECSAPVGGCRPLPRAASGMNLPRPITPVAVPWPHALSIQSHTSETYRALLPCPQPPRLFTIHSP